MMASLRMRCSHGLQAACWTPVVEDGDKRGPVIKLNPNIVILLLFSPASTASSPSCPCMYTQKISLTVNIRYLD
jgi:hypothetical protein